MAIVVSVKVFCNADISLRGRLNILLTDEAIGVRIVEALEQRYTCRISLRFWMAVRREWNFLGSLES